MTRILRLFIAIATLILVCVNTPSVSAETSNSYNARADEVDDQLIDAAQKGDTKAVLSALENGANVNARNKYGLSALMVAAKEAKTDTALALIEKGADVNEADNENSTPLLFATEGGQVDIVTALLEKGADVNARRDDGCTALISAAMGSTSIVRELLRHGADVNAESENVTALITARQYGQTDIVNILMEAGATYNLNEQLMDAAEKGNEVKVRELLAKGADPSAKEHGKTVMTAAKNSRNQAVIRLLASLDPNERLLAAAKEGDTGVVLEMLDKGADIDASDINGDTALILASTNGKKETVLALLKRGADIGATGNSIKTSVELAAENGHMDIVRVLNEAGAPLLTVNQELAIAVNNGDVGAIRDLIKKGANINNADFPIWKNSLYIAACNGDTATLRLLLDAVKELDPKVGAEALRVAIYPPHVDTLRAILDRVRDVNVRAGSQNWPPLLYAVRLVQPECALALLEKGADPSEATEWGENALMAATDHEETDVVRAILTKRDLNLNSKDKDGSTALDRALKTGNGEIIHLIRNAMGESSGATCTTDEQALLKASEKGDVEGVRTLLEKGVNANTKDESGWTPLISAAIACNTEVVRTLLDKGVTIESKDVGGYTALMYAAEKGCLDVVRDLVGRGADVNAKGKLQNTALILSAR